MSGQKTTSDLTTIKIGSRVRHRDGVAGRIAWANGAAMKIKWDDGEKVTWKRADLASKGLEILDDVEPPRDAEEGAPVETPAQVQQAEPATPDEPPAQLAADQTPAEEPPAAQTPAQPAVEPVAAGQAVVAPAKKRRPRQASTDAGKEKKLSALDAAARVLAEEGKPIGCRELIGSMAIKGYWTSPGGKNLAATLYGALLREMETKGDAARFVKVGRGQFALRPQS